MALNKSGASFWDRNALFPLGRLTVEESMEALVKLLDRFDISFADGVAEDVAMRVVEPEVDWRRSQRYRRRYKELGDSRVFFAELLSVATSVAPFNKVGNQAIPVATLDERIRAMAGFEYNTAKEELVRIGFIWEVRRVFLRSRDTEFHIIRCRPITGDNRSNEDVYPAGYGNRGVKVDLSLSLPCSAESERRALHQTGKRWITREQIVPIFPGFVHTALLAHRRQNVHGLSGLGRKSVERLLSGSIGRWQATPITRILDTNWDDQHHPFVFAEYTKLFDNPCTTTLHRATASRPLRARMRRSGIMNGCLVILFLWWDNKFSGWPPLLAVWRETGPRTNVIVLVKSKTRRKGSVNRLIRNLPLQAGEDDRFALPLQPF